METRAAIVVNGVVSNIIVVDSDDHTTLNALNAIVIPDGAYVDIGWSYDGTQFVVPPQPSSTPESLKAALDAHINSVARAKGYDSRITAALRAGYPNPWQAEGIAFGQWMDACYTKAFEIQAEVEAGTRPIPTAEELIAEMPEMVWPVQS